MCLCSGCETHHMQTLNNCWSLPSVTRVTPSLKEALHPGSCLALWHKAPVSVWVLVVFPCVRDGGNFPAHPELQTLPWRASHQLSGAPPQGSCSPLASASPVQESKSGNPAPRPGVPHHRHWVVFQPSTSQLGAKECSLSPQNVLRTLVIQHSWENSVPRKSLSCRSRDPGWASQLRFRPHPLLHLHLKNTRRNQAPLCSCTLSLRSCPACPPTPSPRGAGASSGPVRSVEGRVGTSPRLALLSPDFHSLQKSVGLPVKTLLPPEHYRHKMPSWMPSVFLSHGITKVLPLFAQSC